MTYKHAGFPNKYIVYFSSIGGGQANSRTTPARGLSEGSTSSPLTPNQLTQYILQRLLSTASDVDSSYSHDEIEERIFANAKADSTGFSQEQIPPIRRYLDEAKEQLDVIDFTQPLEQ